MVDRIFAEHARFYVREMRVKAYSQLLQSYRSVTLDSMAASFGVSVPFIDRELSRFIAAGRLNCKIDKVRVFSFLRLFLSVIGKRVVSSQRLSVPLIHSYRSAALWRPLGRTRRMRSTRQ
jgi:hypothetical protein